MNKAHARKAVAKPSVPTKAQPEKRATPPKAEPAKAETKKGEAKTVVAATVDNKRGGSKPHRHKKPLAHKGDGEVLAPRVRELKRKDRKELVRRVWSDLVDGYDEELELEIEDDYYRGLEDSESATLSPGTDVDRLDRQRYFRELFRLQGELVKLQDWVVAHKKKVVIIFEGRDAAGKGGVIKRITQRLNPRIARVVALPAPNDRETTQWYFQRYVPHLPAAGELVLFDRSWYNRAGVERVMGYCTEADVEEFFRSVPEFERMLVRSGIQIIKYWFSISDEEQHLRFLGRLHDPLKQWKLSPMDLESRRRWEGYTKAKEAMFQRTNISEAPWHLVHAVDKKRARLNCIHHLLQQFPYVEVPRKKVTLPKRERNPDYTRHPLPESMYIPDVY